MKNKYLFNLYITISAIAYAFDCYDQSLITNQVHLLLSDNLGNKIFFRKISSTEYDMQVFQIDCKTRKQYKILDLPFLGSSSEVAFSFSFPYSIDKNKYLFISQKIQAKYSTTGIPYVGNYYLNYVLKMENNIYKKDDNLSEFFGDGGDIYDINDINDDNNINPKISYLFPYKTETSIKDELTSSLFDKWKKRELKIGRINKKLNYKKYLIMSKMKKDI